MSLHPHRNYCTCAGGDLPTCRTCEAFEAWEHALSAAERGALAMDFINATTTAHGVLRSEITTRAPWLSKSATVEFNAVAAFQAFLFDHFCSLAMASMASMPWAVAA
ncbi:hypothetical protein [Lysobacter sp. HA35]